MSRAASRIARNTPSLRRGPDPRRSIEHLQFVRGLPCLACGRRPPSEAAHVRVGTDGGTAQKPSDKFAVPLCAGCHGRQHQEGELTFWSELGIDPVDRAMRLWTVSGDPKAAERIIFRARQRIALAALKRKAAEWG